MSYVVKCIATNGASMQKKIETIYHEVGKNWSYNQIDVVDDAVIQKYNDNSTVFTVLGKTGSITTGVASVTGLTAVDQFNGTVHQTTFNLSDVAQAVVNGTEYQGTKIYTFPEGRILVLGATMNLAQKTTSALASTLNASSTGALAVGTVTASATTLASTMANIIPSTAFTSSATIDVAGTAVGGALAASAQFDGHTTPIELYVNTAYATTTDVDADATQTLTGNVTVTWISLGDY